MAYKLDPVFNKEQSEIVRLEIDQDFGKDEETDLLHCNGNLEYKKLDNQVHYLCGSFTGWRYLKMQSLEEFNRKNDRDLKEPIEIAKADKTVR